MNSVLHDIPLAEAMEGALLLDRSLRNEWRDGFEEFSELVKATLPRNLEEIIVITVADKRGVVCTDQKDK